MKRDPIQTSGKAFLTDLKARKAALLDELRRIDHLIQTVQPELAPKTPPPSTAHPNTGNDGMGGRTRKAHVRRTKKGIERSKAEGKKWGAPLKFDAAMVIEMRRLLASGMKVRAACQQLSISGALYYQYRDQMTVWQEGTPWPPPKPTPEQLEAAKSREVDEQQSHLRLVR